MLAGEDFKRIYDETASVIWDLFLQNRLTAEERDFLSKLLDAVIIGKNCPSLLDVLRQWHPSQPESELDQIIKATLMAINFRDEDDLQHNVTLLQELIDDINEKTD